MSKTKTLNRKIKSLRGNNTSSASMSKLAGIYLFSQILRTGNFGKVLIPNMIHDRRICRV